MKLLSADSLKYWDAKIGNSIMFFKSSFILEYNYDLSGGRVFAEYGDFVVDTILVELKHDTLTTALGQKCKILAVNDTLLILYDFTRIWGVDTLKFVKSNDQISYPKRKN